MKRINDEQKAEEDAAKERKKFEDEVSKETIKIKTSEQKLKDKILLLEKLSKAKTSEDIVRIEKDASLEIIELEKSYKYIDFLLFKFPKIKLIIR